MKKTSGTHLQGKIADGRWEEREASYKSIKESVETESLSVLENLCVSVMSPVTFRDNQTIKFFMHHNQLNALHVNMTPFCLRLTLPKLVWPLLVY